MKALILSILAILGLTTFVPQAEARHRDRYIRYYDHCGRPVYGYTYRTCRPTYVYRPRVRYYDHCAPRYSYYSRPGFSVRFGF